jgi:pyridoxal phosphate enzyme (YggS family)
VSVAANVERVRARMRAAATRAGRAPTAVRLVAVSKGFPVDTLRAALAAGVGDLGENRAQELRDKARALEEPVAWHFVGHLQTNKVRYVVGVAGLVHSVDRLAVAEEIGRRARALGVTQRVLVEVNVSGESAKHGVDPAAALTLATDVAALEGVVVGGVMTIPPLPSTPEDSRPYYRQLADVGRGIAAALPGATDVSMGMTRDFEVAIEEGATLVRVGEAIFGPRP